MIAQPFDRASEIKSSFVWTVETQEAFETVKKHLSSTPVLVFPDVREPFILYTDADLTAMGALSYQVQDREKNKFFRHLGHFQSLKRTILLQNENF